MSELIREFKTQNGSSCYIYACETCGCETMRFRRVGRGRVICGVCKRKEEKAYTKAKWDAKLQEAYDKGYADAIDDALSKLYEVTPQTYDEKLDMVFVNALKQLKEQKK